MGVKNTAATCGNTGEASITDFAKGTVFDKGKVNVETQKTLEGQFTDYDCTATTLDMILKDMGYSSIER